MDSLFAQIVPAQKRFDDEGWMNILVIIVMAVLWMVGAVVKAMRTKAENQRQTGRSPTQKPPDQSRGLRQQASPQRAQRPAGPSRPAEHPHRKRTTLAELREAARRFAAEAEQAFKEEAPKSPPRPAKLTIPAPPAPEPQIRPDTKVFAEPTAVPAKGIPVKHEISAQMPRSQMVSDLLSDYEDPERLRKAILHYEILGPPLSLRH